VYTFRFAHPSDLPWLDWATLFSTGESLSPEERRHAVPGTVAHMAREQLRGVLGDPGAAAIVATFSNQPVGFLLAGLNQDSTTEEMNGLLLSLWVHPAHRRRGVGAALLRLGENLFLQRGLRKVKLIAGLHNQAAVHMASRAGYAPEGLIGIKSL